MTALINRQRTSGGVLVPLLIVAILVVLFLMWQAGMFGGGGSSATDSSQTQSSQTDRPNAAAASTPAKPAPSPNAPETANTGTPFTPRPLPNSPGKSPDEIDALVTQLMSAHPQNLAPCSAEPDANDALDCAAAEQSRVLAEVFEDFNARVANGDATAKERGGVAMQRVVQALQKDLESFVQAADGS